MKHILQIFLLFLCTLVTGTARAELVQEWKGKVAQRAENPVTQLVEGWYVLYNVGRNSSVYDDGSAYKMAAMPDASTPFLADKDGGILFHIVPASDGKWSLTSALGHNVELQHNSSAQPTEAHTFTIEHIDNNADAFYMVDAQTDYVADGQERGNNFVGWNKDIPTGAAGNNAYKFYAVEEVPAVMVTYHVTATDAQGENPVTLTVTKAEQLNSVAGTTLEEEYAYLNNFVCQSADPFISTTNTEFSFTATYSFPMEPGKKYQVYQTGGDNRYMAAIDDNDTNITLRASKSVTDANAVWSVVRQEGTFNIYLVNEARQQTIKALRDGTDNMAYYALGDQQAQAYEFVADAAGFKLFEPDSGRNLGAHGHLNGGNTSLGAWNSGRNSGTVFVAEEVVPYTITITGHADGRIIYANTEYPTGTKLYIPAGQSFAPIAKTIDGYAAKVVSEAGVITVTYSNADAVPATVTYIYKNGETEWLREPHATEVGKKFPELRTIPAGVSVTTIPLKILSGTVTGDETFEIQLAVEDTYDVPCSTSYDNATWLYATVHGSNKYFWGYDSSTKKVKTNVNNFSNIKSNDAYKWAIIGNPIIGYQFVNKAAGADMILTSVSPSNDGSSGGSTFPVMTAKSNVPNGHNVRWTINKYDKGDANNHYGYLISREGESICLNRRGNDLAYWTGADDGSRIGFFPVSETITRDTPPAVQGKSYQYRNLCTNEVLTDVSGKTISAGRVSGCYHLSSTATISTTPAVFYVNSSAQWSSLSANAEWIYEEVPAVNPGTTDSEVEFNYGTPEYVTTITSGKYYRLYNVPNSTSLMTDKYTGSGVMGLAAFEDVESVSQVWELIYTAAEANTLGKYKLRNVLTGRYIGAQGTQSAQFPMVNEANAKAFVVQTGTKDGNTYFTFGLAANGNGLHFAPHQSNNVVRWGVSADASKWLIDEVELTPEMKAAAKAFYDEYSAKKDLVNSAGDFTSALRTWFSDAACTELKPQYADYSDADLRTQMSALPEELQEMAVCVKNDKWDNNPIKNYYVKDFRIHNYDIYSDPGVWQRITNVGGFSSLFHPTGITCKSGELLYVMVGEDPKDSDAKLELGIAEATHNGPSQRVELHAGLNIILPNADGEAFVIYRLVNSEKYLNEYPDITVHIEGGEASGCFDMHRGHTNNDWMFLCSQMFTNKYLHIMGEHTVFSVESDRVRGADNITGSLKIWDYIFMTEEKLIGHDGQWNGRYNPVVGARDQYSGNPNWSGTSANYSGIWKDGLLNYNSLLNGDRWVIYHEEAHGHQYPVNLAATTESSNNGFAQMVNHEFGLTSRRADGTKTLVNFKNDGLTWVDMLRGGEGANRGRKYYEEALWVQNHVFYQLYLYFHAAGHMPDFWPRLCDEMRSNGGLKKSADRNNPTKYYEDYLLFAKACAKVSKTDLYEFFDAYGFFGYYDDVFVGNDLEAFTSKDIEATGTRYVGDYGSYYMRMPVRNNPEDERILQEIKDFMHAQPNKAPGIMFIDDHIKDRTVSPDCFAAQLDPTLAGKPVGFYDRGTGRQGDFGDFSDFNSETPSSGIKLTTDGITGNGLVGVKVYDDKGNLKYIFNTSTFTLPDAAKTAVQNGTYTLAVVLGDGTQLPLNSKDYDMNLDGSFTIADVSLLVKALNVTTGIYTTGNVETLRTKVLR